jgi:Tol biopolymer transport system component
MLYRIHAETGHMQTVLQQGFPFSGFALSPDGQQILLAQSVDSGSHLMLMAPDGSEQRVIPFDPPISIRYPCWSPDGEWIAFAGTSENEGTYVYRVRPDGSDLQRLTDTPTQIGDLQWSPDEMWLLFTIIEEAYVGIIRLHPDGSGLERMTVPALYASNPHYAPVAGLRWRPVWLIVAAVGMGLASLRRSSPK